MDSCLVSTHKGASSASCRIRAGLQSDFGLPFGTPCAPINVIDERAKQSRARQTEEWMLRRALSQERRTKQGDENMFEKGPSWAVFRGRRRLRRSSFFTEREAPLAIKIRMRFRVAARARFLLLKIASWALPACGPVPQSQIGSPQTKCKPWPLPRALAQGFPYSCRCGAHRAGTLPSLLASLPVRKLKELLLLPHTRFHRKRCATRYESFSVKAPSRSSDTASKIACGMPRKARRVCRLTRGIAGILSINSR